MVEIGKQIHELINRSLATSDDKSQFSLVKESYAICTANALCNYQNHRKLIQNYIAELERVPKVAFNVLFNHIFEGLKRIAHLFLNSEPAATAYLHDDNTMNTGYLLGKVTQLFGGTHNQFTFRQEIATILTKEERRCLTSRMIDFGESAGTMTKWDKQMIANQLFVADFLYSICRVDDVMEIFLIHIQNFMDRLNSSSHHQECRDIAESVLMKGFEDGYTDYAHLAASRAYSSAMSGNVIAGLLYMCICIDEAEKKGNRISRRVAFEMLWQVAKLLREACVSYPQNSRDFLCSTVDALNVKSYDYISFHHTMFCGRVYCGEDITNDVSDFLNANRETFFSHFSHSVMPWFTLFKAMHKVNPDADFSQIAMYEKAVSQMVDKEGNETMIDIVEGRNLVRRLKEIVAGLGTTRNFSDYSHDVKIAAILAKDLIAQAAADKDAGSFILAMHVRSDFTFVFSGKQAVQFAKFETPDDVAGDELSLYYEEVEHLKQLMCSAPCNATLWIGNGNSTALGSYYCMSLIGNEFTFTEVPQWKDFTNDNEVLATFLSQHLIIEEKKPGEPIYCRSKNELEEDTALMLQAAQPYAVNVPEGAKRLLVVKDMDVAGFPHNMLVNSRNQKFVCEMMPMANIISTEVLVKTNFDMQLSTNFSRSYWSPRNSNEFTFHRIFDHLDKTLKGYGFIVNDDINPTSPICADLNIFCAHGGSNISQTEWFYADNKPITETRNLIGTGKVLVLFVCHSGSATKAFDNNAVQTMIKRYIRLGYSSVIAPMWSLPTDILDVWLQVFMEQMVNGCLIIDAVYSANMAVKEEFSSVSAWGCLHLFGNPYTRVVNKA